MPDDDGSIGESVGGSSDGSNRGDASEFDDSSDDESEQLCEVTGTRQSTPRKSRGRFMSDAEEDEDEPKPEFEPRRSPRFRKGCRDSSLPPLITPATRKSGGGDPDSSESENEDAPRKPPNLDFEKLKNEDKNGQIDVLEDERFWVNRCICEKTGKPGWECRHCDEQWSGVNATKILFHLSQSSGGSIKPCPGSISSEKRQLYKILHSIRSSGRKSCEAARARLKEAVDLDHQRGLEAFMKQPGKKQSMVKKAMKGRLKDPPSHSSSRSIGSASHNWMSNERSDPFRTTPRNQIQMKLTTASPNYQQSLALDFAIGDWLHSNALPFSQSMDPKFRKVIQLAKFVSTSYVTPHRDTVAGKLLTTNYDRLCAENDSNLLADADVYGLGAFGDAATIGKTPYVNMLASSPKHPAVCLEIADCTKQLEDGGEKSAGYIAELFLPHMRRIDPRGKYFDLVTFDGGSNFQKAARILAEHFPKVEVIHGAEHVLGLYFKDMMEHSLMDKLVRVYSKIYGVFGGSHHSVHATFKRNSKLHNNDNYVGLCRPSATRMGRYIIAFLCLMAVKLVFDITMAAPEYSKLKINDNLTMLLKHHDFWALILCVVKANFGPLWLL